MGYVKDNLMPNERIIFTARVHPAVFFPAFISFLGCIWFVVFAINTASKGDAGSGVLALSLLVAAMMFLLSSAVLGIRALITMLTTEFAVTNRRVIAKTGFIRRQTLEILLPKIESVSINQGLLGRLMNFGTVTVTGTGGTKESFRAIVDPIGVRKKINQIVENYLQY